jgi:hypothetical protein
MSTCICRGFSHDPNCPMTPRPETDAPAATTLRDQMIEAGQTVMNGGRPDRNNRWRSEVATVVDALLPLLRAHDAQVAAQARRDTLNKAADAWFLLSLDDSAAKWLRDRAVQDTPDQANT